MSVYYNDNDPFAAAWLPELIAAGVIAPGDVDTRSIVDVQPKDIAGYDQCHFFAGIGGWSYALRLASVADDRAVWTGSCPCQPLSGAGLGRGHVDERHLWPAFYRLIAECRPAAVFGEQVASADGREWLAGVRADLEHLGHAVGAADLCAAGEGAPHIRQRLYWMAAGVVGEPVGARLEGQRGHGDDRHQPGRVGAPAHRPAPASGAAGHNHARFWDAYDLLACTDGKARRIEPGSFPLAHGVPARMGRLRGYGNAIVPQVAARFVTAALAATGHDR